ncbi:MAG: hypothetical protein A2X31_01205 [Elusimicrobia bacterium GWB2_63_22]|nr:MAG: hypothetical protein A2X31_01205 [Elusimicrobia bacterium GWB2_63_22]
MGKKDKNKTVFLHDKAEIAAYLRKDAPLNIYSLGDLDDFFWEHTSWLALKSAGEIKSLALLYTGSSVPTLLALCGAGGRARALELIAASSHLLPESFYAHLSPGLAGGLAKTCALESHGLHHKMALVDKQRALAADASGTAALCAGDLPALLKFYAKSYPGNWFEPRMLATGMYYGVWESGKLAAAAGVHVYSRKYKAAALGNITVRPDLRGRGLGKKVTARVCRELLKRTELIGLNVAAGNASAIACYRSLGFEKTHAYEEYYAKRKVCRGR